jgi:hypothetical protein
LLVGGSSGTAGQVITSAGNGANSPAVWADPAAAGPVVKAGRVTTGTINGGSTGTPIVTWASPFADANYSVTCTVQEGQTIPSLIVEHIITPVIAANVTVLVRNGGVGAATGTLHCIAVHD